MKNRARFVLIFVTAVAGVGGPRGTEGAQNAGFTSGPDPREIAIPAIKTASAKMPGVRELPVLGAADRLGVNWTDRPHGMVQGDWDALLAFADKFLLGKKLEQRFDRFPAP